MRAAVIERFGPPEVLKIREVDKPTPGPGQILVEIVAAGVNPVDAQNRRDGSWAGITPPAILGSDASGIVSEVGADVTAFAAGDEVFYFSDFLGTTRGSYAEYQVTEAAQAAPKPANISHLEAAAVPLAGGTAYELIVRRLSVSSGQSVLILGAGGGVGSYAIQLARLAGAKVIAVADKDKHDLLRELGATVTADYREVGRVIAAEGPVDALADLVGGPWMLSTLGLLRPEGRAATIVELKGNFEAAIDRNLTLHGVLVRPDGARLCQLAELLKREELHASVTSEHTLDDVVDAHRRLEERHGKGKIVLRVRPEPRVGH